MSASARSHSFLASVLFAFNLVGGGDAKLMAAGALWMGFDLALPFLAYITIFGGMLSLVILAYRRFVPGAILALPGWAMRLHQHGGGIPYGIAIAAAGLALYPQTPFFTALRGLMRPAASDGPSGAEWRKPFRSFRLRIANDLKKLFVRIVSYLRRRLTCTLTFLGHSELPDFSTSGLKGPRAL